MNELDFRRKLFDWNIREKTILVPTSAEVLLFGQHKKIRVILKEHEPLVYAHIKELEISDDLYKKLSEQMKLNDSQILKVVQKNYIQYLTGIRKKILSLQKEWNRNYAQFRATKAIKVLKYDNIYHICDISNERRIPIELILKMIFDVSSNYGDHRRIKEKEEIYMDPRVLKTWTYLKEYASRTTIGSKKS